ncbi:Homeobox KN domain containing protein [Lactarius tabidus]
MSGLGDAAPISGKGERKPEEERSLTSLNFMLPSTCIDTIVSHSSQTPSLSSAHAASAASSLVDSPRRMPAIPKAITDVLKNWLHRHSDHPYPSEDEMKQLCAATGLSKNQVSNWMINARRRIIAPGHRSSRSGIVADPGVKTSIQLGELDQTPNAKLDSDDVNV